VEVSKSDQVRAMWHRVALKLMRFVQNTSEKCWYCGQHIYFGRMSVPPGYCPFCGMRDPTRDPNEGCPGP
jgi:hypothetical protein